MPCITTGELATILLGTEHSGSRDSIYEVNFAVPNSLLGSSRGGNNSGFSFGIVQLDIGVNDFAQQAYSAILDNSLSNNIITQAQYNRLLSYEGSSRYDLDLTLSSTYLADRDLLNNTIFTRQETRGIVDNYNDLYLEQSLLGIVQTFLNSMTSAWGTENVFDYNNGDYHLAVAAITSLANRFGSLTTTTAHFAADQPKTIADVRAWFDTRLPTTNANDWQLVQTGADLFAESDTRYEGVNATTSFGSAVALLGVDSINDVVELFLKSEIGNCISDVTYFGSGDAGFLVDNFLIPGVFNLDGGIFLSSGGFPSSSNTSNNFTVEHGKGGDDDLTNTAATAFPGSGVTQDASVLEFTINIVGNVINGIAFDIVFGSDEYPEYSNTFFVDIAAIYINGKNVALFNDDPTTPLSVIQQNVSSGNFFNNESGTFATEWDGFSNVLRVRAALSSGESTIKIGVADTGDSVLDSGIYVNNIELIKAGATGGGVLSVINGDDGDNTIVASLRREEINLFAGADIVSGTPAELNGDIITGFGNDDVLVFSNVLFGLSDLSVTFGSAILKIDTNQDGNVDTTVTLQGNFEGSEFHVNQVAGSTEVTATHNVAPTASPINAGNVLENTGLVGIDLLADAGASDSDGGTLGVANVTVVDGAGQPVLFTLTGALLSIDLAQFATALGTGDSTLLSIAYQVTDGQGGLTPNSGTLVVDGLDGPFTWYADGDTDGFGVDDVATNQNAYAAPANTAGVAGDADDADGTVYPGAPEINDGKDNDQDGTTDEDNSAPVADAETVQVARDGFIAIPVAVLLAGDTDADGDVLTVTGVSGAVNGTVLLDNKGDADPTNDEVIFTPTPGFSGAAAFDYTVSDGFGGSDSATVSVGVINQISGNTGLDYLVGTDGPDAIRSLAGSYDRMAGGGGADQFIFGAEALNGIRERDVILDYEVGVDSIVLENGASVGSIRQTSNSVVIFLEGDGDAIYVLGEGVTASNLTIVGVPQFDFFG